MAFKLLATLVPALLLTGCCCFGGSVDEVRNDTEIIGWYHTEGTGNGI